MSRTSVGVPDFSCSVLVMAVTIVGLEELLDSVGHDEIPWDVLDDDVTSQGAINAGGASERKNSSTCSKHPRKISCSIKSNN